MRKIGDPCENCKHPWDCFDINCKHRLNDEKIQNKKTITKQEAYFTKNTLFDNSGDTKLIYWNRQTTILKLYTKDGKIFIHYFRDDIPDLIIEIPKGMKK